MPNIETREGVYVTCDDALCDECYERAGGLEGWRERGGFEGWPAPIDIPADDEVDTPTHCVECGALIEQTLTDHGRGYVAEAIVDWFRRGEQNPVSRMWLERWGDVLDADAFDELHSDGGGLHPGTVTELATRLPMDMGEWGDKYRGWLERAGVTFAIA